MSATDPNYIKGFVEACYRYGLHEKQAAALLQTSEFIKQAGMEKQAGPFLTGLKELAHAGWNLTKATGNGLLGTGKGSWGLAKKTGRGLRRTGNWIVNDGNFMNSLGRATLLGVPLAAGGMGLWSVLQNNSETHFGDLLRRVGIPLNGGNPSTPNITFHYGSPGSYGGSFIPRDSATELALLSGYYTKNALNYSPIVTENIAKNSPRTLAALGTTPANALKNVEKAQGASGASGAGQWYTEAERNAYRAKADYDAQLNAYNKDKADLAKRLGMNPDDPRIAAYVKHELADKLTSLNKAGEKLNEAIVKAREQQNGGALASLTAAQAQNLKEQQKVNDRKDRGTGLYNDTTKFWNKIPIVGAPIGRVMASWFGSDAKEVEDLNNQSKSLQEQAKKYKEQINIAEQHAKNPTQLPPSVQTIDY